jgi:hypothetical protein
MTQLENEKDASEINAIISSVVILLLLICSNVKFPGELEMLVVSLACKMPQVLLKQDSQVLLQRKPVERTKLPSAALNPSTNASKSAVIFNESSAASTASSLLSKFAEYVVGCC